MYACVKLLRTCETNQGNDCNAVRALIDSVRCNLEAHVHKLLNHLAACLEGLMRRVEVTGNLVEGRSLR